MAMTEAQIRAMNRQKQKRVGQPRLPGSCISDTENQLLNEMAEKHGSKKAAIFKGLKLLKNSTKC